VRMIRIDWFWAAILVSAATIVISSLPAFI
jgi:hypothetical protein